MPEDLSHPPVHKSCASPAVCAQSDKVSCTLPNRPYPVNSGLLETLTKSYDTLEAIQKSLEEYLETKRVAFPRYDNKMPKLRVNTW